LAPTPELERRGLSPDTLKSIIDDINSNAEQQYQQKKHCFNRWWYLIPLILLALDIIIFAAAPLRTNNCPDSVDSDTTIKYIRSYNYCNESHTVWYWIGCAIATMLWFFLFIILPMILFYIRCSQKKKIRKCMESMRDYVEKDLNERFQKSNGIRWCILERQIIMNGSKGRVSAFTLYDIGITALRTNINCPLPTVQNNYGFVPTFNHNQQQIFAPNPNNPYIANQTHSAYVPKMAPNRNLPHNHIQHQINNGDERKVFIQPYREGINNHNFTNQ